MRLPQNYLNLFCAFTLCLIPILVLGQPNADSFRISTGPLLDQAKVKLGQTVPADLIVYSEAGTPRSLLDVVNGKYTVLVTGCLTCPIFHRTYPGVEAVYQDYKDFENLQFFYVYKTLAHPEYQGYIQPVTLDERLTHIVEAKRVLSTSLEWLCDGMDNAARHTLGLGPNTQLILDPLGKIVHTRGWSDGDVLRKELQKLVGDSPTRTAVSDLDIEKKTPAMAQKLLPRSNAAKPRFNTTLIPVQIRAKEAEKLPLYVKPRIEVEPTVFQRGRGEMYLGFHLDPIHHVHWNNLAAPLQYEWSLPDGVFLTPKKAEAPEVGVDADAAPREFVIEINSVEEGDVLDLTFHYFACSDEEGWCLPVTQKYEVAMLVDKDGGGTMGRSFGRGSSRQNQRQPGQASRGQGANRRSPDQIKERILESDTDGDGIVLLEDLPQQIRRNMARMDANQDGALNAEEIDAIAQRMGRGPQSGAPGRQGPGAGGRGQVRGADPVARMRQMDANGDGKLTQDEMPEQFQQRFGRMDENGDGVIDEAELNSMAERFGRGQGRQPSRRAQPPNRTSRDTL